jgi:hypothetical protein
MPSAFIFFTFGYLVPASMPGWVFEFVGVQETLALISRRDSASLRTLPLIRK